MGKATKLDVTVRGDLAGEDLLEERAVHVEGVFDARERDDMPVSPRLESTRGNVAFALAAFKTPLADVGARCAHLVAEEPGRTSGRIYPMLGMGHVIVGGAKMAWWGMTGKMARG